MFAIAVKTEKEKSISELISIDTVKKTQASLLRLTDEDSKAFTSLSYPFVYTNLGRNQMYACNAENGRNILYRRTSSMPLKAVRTGEKIVVLNGNGSVIWYDIKSQASCGDWFVTVKGEWFEL